MLITSTLQWLFCSHWHNFLKSIGIFLWTSVWSADYNIPTQLVRGEPQDCSLMDCRARKAKKKTGGNGTNKQRKPKRWKRTFIMKLERFHRHHPRTISWSFATPWQLSGLPFPLVTNAVKLMLYFSLSFHEWRFPRLCGGKRHAPLRDQIISCHWLTSHEIFALLAHNLGLKHLQEWSWCVHNGRSTLIRCLVSSKVGTSGLD